MSPKYASNILGKGAGIGHYNIAEDTVTDFKVALSGEQFAGLLSHLQVDGIKPKKSVVLCVFSGDYYHSNSDLLFLRA
jgi:hypothetical protein